MSDQATHTLTRADLTLILDRHRKWLHGEPDGARADFTGADFTRANCTGAVLTRANCTGANFTRADFTGADFTRANCTGADFTRANCTGAVLTGANFTRANCTGANFTRANCTGAVLTGANFTRAVLSDGVRWDEYLREVVPALLTAGGRPLAEVATAEHWECHAWGNCPMSAAFGVDGIAQVPALHRWQAARFVQFFDAHLIPRPVVEEGAA